MIQIGSIINKRYKLIDLIGFGGMATVYMARDIQTGETFAVKIMDYRRAQDKDFLNRFEKEVKIGITLDHPNIVKVYSYGKIDNYYFIVMEYVQGINIRQYLKQYGIFEWKHALSIILQILSALSYAYHKGIQAHRDIKPENIMIDTKTMSVKVMDFGIAKIESSNITQTTLIYTPRYASPEQLAPAKYQNNINHTTDLFSLAVIFYEMITGKHPFPGNTSAEIMDRELNTIPASPSAINPDIPPWISNVILRSLNPNPDKRPQTPEEVAYALRNKKVSTKPIEQAYKTSTNNLYKTPSKSNNKNLSKILIPSIGASIVVCFVVIIFWLVGINSNKYGALNLKTEPAEANIYIDGKLYEKKSPFLINKLEVGLHNITLKKDGYQDYGTFVEVKSKNTTSISCSLKPLPKVVASKNYGYLFVATTPEGANIYIDDVFKGFSTELKPNANKEYIELSPGDHILKLTKTGYYGEIQKITIKAEERKSLHFTLNLITEKVSYKEKKEREKPIEVKTKRSEYGIARIESEPPDALVYLNDVYIGDTPIECIEKSGTYNVKLSKEGYKDSSIFEINIPDNNQKITKKIVLVLDIGIPTLESPTNKSNNVALNPTFQWTNVEKATFYELIIKDNVTGKILFNRNNQKIQSNKFILPYGILSYSRTYSWQVVAGNKYGYGPSSFVWTFKTIEQEKPIVIKPPSGIKDEYSVKFNSSPPDARIYIDEVYAGSSTPATFNVKKGMHKIWIWKDGYKRYESYINVDRDGIIINVNLVK
jgi:serine/threonine protein kinase